ncbi:sigma-54-dependent Fis family transcriptional regulator [Acidaminobacter sp. JC074]|uniref:sigma-54 interaction domain-containing protein n=1 Tax=Acidaminobacter sp. JC074 TaxID=2530199 RepID=UPI001F103069|nr:sigma-54 dependent transcriptional regulator [Acidaminobacter sp. JC074]MCH4886833.1 sigma-54-dependent Fis family transcriptional regulator [Acidaminobacter sp. JC074]
MKYKLGIVLDLHRGLGEKLIRDLKLVFSDSLDYELFYTDNMTSMDHCDLVLVMIKEKVLEILPYISQPEKILTIKRTLTYDSVARIKGLESSNVLVVNDKEETTLDLVITLHRLGLTHINWLPYYKDHNYDTSTALTANEAHLVPNGHEIIDIGFRPMDISTIIDIMHVLQMDSKDFYQGLMNYKEMNVPLDKSVLTRLEKSHEAMKLSDVLEGTNVKSGHVSYYEFKDIITESEAMHQMIEKAKKLSKHDINVLIIGESGTGKELIAQGIHQSSYRRKLPFVGVNVTAIPNNLLESELFGYVPGAFTGANKSGHKGLFEQCNGGTLFLDEIGDLPLELQGKLLRALEEKCIRPIGSNSLTKINVRIVAATNKDLRKEIQAGRFREDLYYRLKASVLMIPPLRDRQDDVSLLIRHFVGDHFTFDQEALNVLKSYDWKGNVRELKHACEYCKIMATGGLITMDDIPDDLMTDTSDPYFDQEKTYWVLDSIDRCSKLSASVGRKSILEDLNAEGHLLGEGELKTILKHLKTTGCIVQGRGRKGSVLTVKGKTVLSNYVQ